MQINIVRLYFVLLIGRDRRNPTKAKEAKRRQRAVWASAMMSVYMLLCILAPVVFLVLYLIKSALGIDIFGEFHLSDLILW